MSDFKVNAWERLKKKSKTSSTEKTTFSHYDDSTNRRITVDQRIKGVNTCYVPESIRSPHELKWLLEIKMTSRSSEKLYFPVHVLHSKSTKNDRNSAASTDNSSDDNDDELEAKVEFLSVDSHHGNRKVRQISTKRLLPYHNNCLGSNLDWVDICRSTWNEELLTTYIAQENLMSNNDCIRAYLENVLSVAKERDGYMMDECDDDDNLAEPYTQAMNMDETERYDSDEDIMKIMKHGKTFVAKEPILPGDVIEYYCPMFVYGSKQGLRTATVMSIDPQRNYILELSTGEFLEKDSRIKRVKTVSIFQGEQVLVDHPGVVRAISSFKLRKINKPKNLKVQTETARIKKSIKGVIQKFQNDVKDCEVAPMDILVRFKGLEGMADDDDSVDCEINNKRSTNTQKESRDIGVSSDSDSNDSVLRLLNIKSRQHDNPEDDESDESGEDMITTFLRNQTGKTGTSKVSSSSKLTVIDQLNGSNRIRVKNGAPSMLLSLQDSVDESGSESNILKMTDTVNDAEKIDFISDQLGREKMPIKHLSDVIQTDSYSSSDEGSSKCMYNSFVSTIKIPSGGPRSDLQLDEKKQTPKKNQVSHERSPISNSKPKLPFLVKKFNNH